MGVGRKDLKELSNKGERMGKKVDDFLNSLYSIIIDSLCKKTLTEPNKTQVIHIPPTRIQWLVRNRINKYFINLSIFPIFLLDYFESGLIKIFWNSMDQNRFDQSVNKLMKDIIKKYEEEFEVKPSGDFVKEIFEKTIKSVIEEYDSNIRSRLPIIAALVAIWIYIGKISLTPLTRCVSLPNQYMTSALSDKDIQWGIVIFLTIILSMVLVGIGDIHRKKSFLHCLEMAFKEYFDHFTSEKDIKK